MLTIALASFSLGISSLMERTSAASLAVIALLIFSFVAAALCSHVIFDDPAWMGLSPFRAMERVGDYLLPPVPQQVAGLGDLDMSTKEIPIAFAWQSLWAWTGFGLLLLWWRVRKVEVVS
jgi:hypothetical protein